MTVIHNKVFEQSYSLLYIIYIVISYISYQLYIQLYIYGYSFYILYIPYYIIIPYYLSNIYRICHDLSFSLLISIIFVFSYLIFIGLARNSYNLIIFSKKQLLSSVVLLFLKNVFHLIIFFSLHYFLPLVLYILFPLLMFFFLVKVGIVYFGMFFHFNMSMYFSTFFFKCLRCTCHKFLCLVFSFLFSSKYFSIFPLMGSSHCGFYIVECCILLNCIKYF